MIQGETLLLLLLIVNTLLVAGYVIRCLPVFRRKDPAVGECLIRITVMVFCPIVGPMFFSVGWLARSLLFKREVGFEDLVLSKKRVRTALKADEERESNVAPLEEALAVSDVGSLRTLVMNVVRGDVKNHLGVFSQALNSSDAETAHYAATVLQDALNEFRQTSQELYQAVRRDDDRSSDAACRLLEYIYDFLGQKALHTLERRTYVDIMEEACQYLYEKAPIRMKAEYIDQLCELLLGEQEYRRMKLWCDRGRRLYPDEPLAYTGYLKLYFATGDRENFFDVLDQLKRSGVVIDKQTLDLIRAFTDPGEKKERKSVCSPAETTLPSPRCF